MSDDQQGELTVAGLGDVFKCPLGSDVSSQGAFYCFSVKVYKNLAPEFCLPAFP